MIQNALFVLGAGASCPYGFPSGEELRKLIIDRYVEDCKEYLTAQQASGALIPSEEKRAREFVETFRKSTTMSIDLFLARNPEYSVQGKRAIILRILAAERESHFREDVKDSKQDWYRWLWKRLTDELERKEDYSRFHENDISFITFNYDRSLEYFLYDSFVNSFKSIPGPKIIEQLNHIRICHIFGQVAPLEWQGPGWIEYGANLDQVRSSICENVVVPSVCENVKIVYEKGENPKLKDAQELIGKANRIFFLGFGYAKENLAAIGVPGVLKNVDQIFGTALGLTPIERARVSSSLQAEVENRSRRVTLYPDKKDCLALLRGHFG